MLFMNFALTCAFYFCFHLGEGIFFMTLLFRVCIQTSWLGAWLCLYLNPHAVCINSVWQPASSFRLNFCFCLTSCLTSGTALTLCVQIPYCDPRLYCSVSVMAMGHWWISQFKGFQKRTPWKLKFAACRILCLVEQERKDSSEVDLLVLRCIFHKIGKILV